MDIFFSAHPAITRFKAFSAEHVAAMGVLVAVNAIILVYYRHADRDSAWRFRVVLACVMLALELVTFAWEIHSGIWSADGSLPLNLCRIGVYVSAVMLLTGNYTLYEISYFWSLGGALNAIVTPTLGTYNYPHFYFFKFFVSHDCLILAVLFFTITMCYRITWKSLLRALAITHVYIIPVAVVNYVFDANYLYICENPGKNTLMGFFGPWPEYLLPLWVIGVVFFTVLYLPFAVSDFKRKRVG